MQIPEFLSYAVSVLPVSLSLLTLLVACASIALGYMTEKMRYVYGAIFVMHSIFFGYMIKGFLSVSPVSVLKSWAELILYFWFGTLLLSVIVGCLVYAIILYIHRRSKGH